MKKSNKLAFLTTTAAALAVAATGNVTPAAAAEVSQIPDGAVINPETNNAFHESQIGTSLASFEIINAINAGKDVYFKLPGSTSVVNVTNNQLVSSETVNNLPELSYVDKDGQQTTIPGAQAGELKVESVSAINANAVTVTFPEITTAIEDANVVVKDGEGKVVETKPMLLAEGTTQADFEFVTPFPVDHKFTGVWDVNGKKYNFDAINQLADIVEAAVTTPNQIKLQTALDAAGITYADELLIAKYLTALQAEGATASLEAVQKAITKIDEDTAKDEANDAAVEAVLDAKTQAQLLKALQANFDVVNPEWIVEYQAAIAEGEPETVEEIQEAVYNVNLSVVGPKVDAANMSLDSVKVVEARTLVTNWVPAISEDDEVSMFAGLKEQLLDLLNVEDALIAVDQAKTNSALKTALVNLDKLETELVEKYPDAGLEKEFFIKDVEDANLTAYRDAVKAAEVGAKNQRKDIQKIVTDANNVAVDTAKTKVLKDLNEVTAKTAAADVVALLEKSQELNDQTNKVNSAYADAYKTAVVEAVAGEETLTAGEVNTLIGTVNAAQDAKAQLAAVNAASTASEMSKALIALEAANNKTDFTNLSSTAKLEVAEIVLAKRNAIVAGDDQKAKEFKDLAAALAAVSHETTGAIAVRTAFLTDVNDETTIAGVQAALAGENSLLPEFKTLGAAAQVEKAEAVLNALTALKADGKAGFSTVTEIKTIVE
ncbi:hypothetical protein [Sporosarcina obsidiansis]|uniref:hypothetical protein n=1 Tax=Sporosarcina obsidiansis TaxID=2660748 RepID=UPI00129C00B5|nr:hypothetical protein [Sporosarcina obsidiansis]